MNIDKKTCINIGIVAFLLYLAIHYWDGLVGLFNLFLAAAGTLINGAIIAYVLNILMRFYERHMAPNTKKKVWNAMRRPVCMALAFLTLVAVIVALIQIILPQLISCVQVLLSSLPGVLRQMYDKLMGRSPAPHEPRPTSCEFLANVLMYVRIQMAECHY